MSLWFINVDTQSMGQVVKKTMKHTVSSGADESDDEGVRHLASSSIQRQSDIWVILGKKVKVPNLKCVLQFSASLGTKERFLCWTNRSTAPLPIKHQRRPGSGLLHWTQLGGGRWTVWHHYDFFTFDNSVFPLFHNVPIRAFFRPRDGGVEPRVYGSLWASSRDPEVRTLYWIRDMD